ncbi:acetyl-CoA carboxylase carboxyltransferase subunit alpha [Nonomuraea insulae]|uniref:Multifunctional fusion protein n=1 Tax=Nonomuraea insulae TaxID=1616787 RepID=A0ABW1CNF1_9ACTN
MSQDLVAPTATRESSDDTQWVKCPSCDAFLYIKRLERNLRVCPECRYHFRLSVTDRLRQLLDDGVLDERGQDVASVDVLEFVDSKAYTTRLEEARRKTGRRDAASYGYATIGGHRVVVAAMDFGFMGGSMGGAVGEIITRGAEEALETRTPLLIIAASGGARMQEGCVSLMQLAKTSQTLARLKDAGVLYICVLTDPTFGGVTASYAMLGDVLISEPGALVGFAGPQVIEQTIRQKLPENFQTAEFLLAHGMLDLVTPRENLRQTLTKLLRLHAARRQDRLPVGEGRPAITDPGELRLHPAWEVVQRARDAARPTTLEYAGYLCDDFLELQGDRLYADNSSIVGGLGSLAGRTVMLIGHQKGHNTAELVARNFGMPEPEGYRKAIRLMQYAARFGLPVITLVDTPGAFPGLGAEERGQAVAIAQSIMEMSRLPVPIVTVVTGEGGSGGALALAVGDRVMMMENAYYSVISPEGCSVILWNNAAKAPQAAEALRVRAAELLTLRIMDAVVPEPEGGAQADHLTAATNLKHALVTCLNDLLPLDTRTLLEARYQRFRLFGTPGVQPVLRLQERAR